MSAFIEKNNINNCIGIDSIVKNQDAKVLRILHVVTTMDFGGVETLLMEIYRHIDREKVQFDFLCHNTVEGKYSDEIKQLGGRVYAIKSVKRSFGASNYKRHLRTFILAHPEYHLIHCHINAYNGFVLQEAKECGILVRISHSHVSEYKMNKLLDYYSIKSMKLINDNATDYFACSEDAAHFIYKDERIVNKTVIFNNAIDTLKFKFNDDFRDAIRKRYRIQDKYVFIHVGRFMSEKNHHFLIKTFSEILKRIPDAVLMLLGAGPLEGQIREQVDSLGISEHVIFGGSQPNVKEYLSAADVFLFPSLFEGLGIVAVEAQCSGLPTFASDTVPQEAKRTDLLQFLPLSDGAEAWAERIVPVALKTHEADYLHNRAKYAEVVKESGYDIVDKAKWLERFYLEH